MADLKLSFEIQEDPLRAVEGILPEMETRTNSKGVVEWAGPSPLFSDRVITF